MGRPLQKKYFGNTNTVQVGGEGVASYGSITAGSGWTSIPTVTVGSPLPGGVIATVLSHYKSSSAAVVAAGTGYNYHDVLTLATGTASVAAQFEVSAIKAASATVQAAGTSGWAINDTFTFTNAGGTNTVLTVTAVNVSNQITTVSVTTAGSRIAAKPTNPVTANSTTGSGVGTPTFNILWGVNTLTSTPVVDGNYTVFPSTGGATTVLPSGGTGATLTATMKLLSVSVVTSGAGYYQASDAALTFSGSTGAAATATLTNSNLPAIKASAYITGGSAHPADIVKQESTKTYRVITSDGTGVCKLVAAAPAAGQMTLTATDSDGGTYYVTKLTAHKAVIVKGGRTGTQFTTGSTGISVPWTFGSAVEGYSVTILNG